MQLNVDIVHQSPYYESHKYIIHIKNMAYLCNLWTNVFPDLLWLLLDAIDPFGEVGGWSDVAWLKWVGSQLLSKGELNGEFKGDPPEETELPLSWVFIPSDATGL